MNSRGKLRVLYCAVGDDYGDSSRGPSYERMNFEGTLERMDVELLHFDIAAQVLKRGYFGAGQHLLGLVESWNPQVLFSVMFEEQLSRDVVERISSHRECTTIAWFCDDHWRFEAYSRHWARAFNWVVTTDREAVSSYRCVGQPNVLLSQWACNHFVYRPFPEARRFGVTFVGQPHGRRLRLIERLRSVGVPVDVWGTGWPAGRLSTNDMIEVFSGSLVNLNFSEASQTSAREGKSARPAQVKGRVFEVAGCGGILLTEDAPGLEDYFSPEQEIVVFRNEDEMIAQARRLLADRGMRERLSRAARARTLREHTYVHRLSAVFGAAGLWSDSEVVRQLYYAGCQPLAASGNS